MWVNQCVHLHTQCRRDDFDREGERGVALLNRGQGGKAEAGRFVTTAFCFKSPGHTASIQLIFGKFYNGKVGSRTQVIAGPSLEYAQFHYSGAIG